MNIHGKIEGGLVSVILDARGPLAATRRCVEALLRHTRRPWELIAVAEGETAIYLAGLRDALPIHAEIVPPAPDPEAFRLAPALSTACGDYLAFLDSGTIVTEGWLDALTALVDSKAKPGLVGPMLPDAPPPQLAEGSAGLEPIALTRFAEGWRKTRRRQWFTVDRLAEGCVLIRRQVLEAVDGRSIRSFDELGARLLARGLELGVAHDLFVDHAPPPPALSSIEAEVPQRRLVPKGIMNLSARAPSKNRPDLGPDSRPVVSLTMIVRNEEENLGPCLESARGLFDEVVVVDTGSTDRTRDVALSFGAKVVDFAWVDDFSAARNVALEHATGRFAFWLDADDRIDEANRDRIRGLIDRLGDAPAAYVMKQLSANSEGKSVTTTSADHVRLFPIRDDIRWSYRVHEQIVPAIRAAGVPVEWTDIGIGHVGYLDDSLRVRKLDRNLRILKAEIREKPGDPFVLFNLGWIAIDQKEARTGLGYLRASLAASSPRDSIVLKTYVLIARAYQMLDDPASALAACVAGREYGPDDAELLFREGLIRREGGDLDGAATCWQQILHAGRPQKFSSIVSDIHGHLTRRFLAGLAESRGDSAGALQLWEEILLERPGDPDALRARKRLGGISPPAVVVGPS